MHTMNEVLRAFYRDWVNNYLTVEGMAEQHGISPKTCGKLIDLGRKLHEKYVAETAAA